MYTHCNGGTNLVYTARHASVKEGTPLQKGGTSCFEGEHTKGCNATHFS